jgi:hypothetical protein
MKLKPSLSVTLLIWLVLSFTGWNAVRFATSLAWNDTLDTYAPRPGAFYIGGTGAVWTLAGIFLLWSIWRGAGWTRKALLTASGLYAAWVWMDRLFVQARTQANWPFALLSTILLLAYMVAVVLNPHNQVYFERETYERKSKNPPPA